MLPFEGTAASEVFCRCRGFKNRKRESKERLFLINNFKGTGGSGIAFGLLACSSLVVKII